MNDFEDMLNDIQSSEEYLKYKEIGDILESDSFVMNLMNEIKNLQQEALILEYDNNPKYLILEKIIEEKVEILNNNSTYKLYLSKMEEYTSFIKKSICI